MDTGLAIRKICLWLDENNVDDLVEAIKDVDFTSDDLFKKSNLMPEVLMMWHAEMTIEFVTARKEQFMKLLTEKEYNILITKPNSDEKLAKKLSIMKLYLN